MKRLWSVLTFDKSQIMLTLSCVALVVCLAVMVVFGE